MPFLASASGTFGYGRPTPAQSGGGGGGIVTSGLIIQLDACNASSYPGSGTTWSNLQTTSYGNGTLTNGPTFTAAAPTYFNFDGTDDYVNIADNAAIRPSVGGAVTGIIWAYITSYVSQDGLISKQFGAPTYDGFSLVMNTNNRMQLNMNGGSINGNYVSGTTNNFSLNTWTMFTCIPRFGGGAVNPSLVYVNTTQVVSASNGELSIPSNNAPLQLVNGIQEGTPNPHPACRVGSFYYYNRALAGSEISTMYGITRTRYGV
jgi:hypothetical protein